MGVCQTETQKAEFTAYFSANLRQLYDSYKALLEYLKPSKLFAQTSQELNLLVETYLANPKIIDKENLGICSIDSVHKLHPIDYGTNKATKQWLINACLRQNKFIQELPYQLLNFDQCYRHYVQFLYLCFKNPNSVIVPNKLADFMWHSHMQDNEKYKEDSKKMLKRVLNHTDDFTEEQMKIFAQQTEKTRKRLLRQPPKKANTIEKESSSSSYHNFVFINYGGGMCGGGYYPIDNHDIHPHPHPPHPHDNTHPHHPDHHHDTHPHHNDHHHHDTNPSNDTGGHHHSNCGGGHSSCGGGGSSCGGGGSSCGGGGSSCGGGGSSCGGGD